MRTRLGLVYCAALLLPMMRAPNHAAISCAPLSDTVEAPRYPFERSLEGHYRVQMHTLPMDSRGTSRQIEFELWLWPSSDRDSSAKTGVRVAPGDTAAHPYFGATRGYVEADDSSGRAPRRADVDPVYARVIMLRILGDSIGRAPAAILVWTIATRSPGWMGLDGAGEALWVSEISPTGFRGRWVPWGIVTRGEGYYCAERVKD